jgi:hypothetical protein
MKKPNTTIFCAVWSGDGDRHSLIKAHYQNLKNQTTPVNIVYVFDCGDTPQSSLEALTLVINKPLTIYEAWNLAIASCQTKYIMNLNLDDRLSLNAVEYLEQAIEAQNGDLVGGDWKVCHTQQETDLVGNCVDANAIPFMTDWPPQKNSFTRLGSGTGDRGTFGPATLWKLDNHINMPRYPYRTEDNIQIRSISDSIWWSLLANNFKKKLIRIPIIIGNYHSHPDTQAEFRVENEWSLIQNKKISMI